MQNALIALCALVSMQTSMRLWSRLFMIATSQSEASVQASESYGARVSLSFRNTRMAVVQSACPGCYMLDARRIDNDCGGWALGVEDFAEEDFGCCGSIISIAPTSFP